MNTVARPVPADWVELRKTPTDQSPSIWVRMADIVQVDINATEGGMAFIQLRIRGDAGYGVAGWLNEGHFR